VGERGGRGGKGGQRGEKGGRGGRGRRGGREGREGGAYRDEVGGEALAGSARDHPPKSCVETVPSTVVLEHCEGAMGGDGRQGQEQQRLQGRHGEQGWPTRILSADWLKLSPPEGNDPLTRSRGPPYSGL